MQRATSILEVAYGEMVVALAYFTHSLNANQQGIDIGLNSNNFLPYAKLSEDLVEETR